MQLVRGRPSLLCESASTLKARAGKLVEQLGAAAAAVQLRSGRTAVEQRRTPGEVDVPPTQTELKRRRRRELYGAKGTKRPPPSRRGQGEMISR